MLDRPLGAFCKTFDLHQAITRLENLFWSSFEWQLKTGFTVPPTYGALGGTLENEFHLLTDPISLKIYFEC